MPDESCHIKGVKAQFTYWQEDNGTYLGFLNEYPDHWTQGTDFEDLKLHLIDLYKTFSSDNIPGIRKVDELVIA